MTKLTLLAIMLASLGPFVAAEGCNDVPKPVRVYSGTTHGDLVYTITDKTKTMAIDDDSGYVGLRLGTTALLHATQEDTIQLTNGTDKKRVVDFTRQRLALFRKKVQTDSPGNFEKLKTPLEKLETLLAKDMLTRDELSRALDEVEKNFGNMRVQSKTKTSDQSQWGPETDVSKLDLPDFHSSCEYIRLNPNINEPKTRQAPQASVPANNVQ